MKSSYAATNHRSGKLAERVEDTFLTLGADFQYHRVQIANATRLRNALNA